MSGPLLLSAAPFPPTYPVLTSQFPNVLICKDPAYMSLLSLGLLSGTPGWLLPISPEWNMQCCYLSIQILHVRVVLYSVSPFTYIISSDGLDFIDHFMLFIQLQQTSKV